MINRRSATDNKKITTYTTNKKGSFSCAGRINVCFCKEVSDDNYCHNNTRNCCVFSGCINFLLTYHYFLPPIINDLFGLQRADIFDK